LSKNPSKLSELVRSNVVERELSGSEVLVQLGEVEVLGVELL